MGTTTIDVFWVFSPLAYSLHLIKWYIPSKNCCMENQVDEIVRHILKSVLSLSLFCEEKNLAVTVQTSYL